MDAKAFGRRLKQLRAARRVSQTELAESLGVNQKTISSYETGIAWPSAPLLIELSRVLGVSADHLLGIKVSRIRTPNDPGNGRVRKVAKMLAALPERDQRAILRMIRTSAKASSLAARLVERTR